MFAKTFFTHSFILNFGFRFSPSNSLAIRSTICEMLCFICYSKANEHFCLNLRFWQVNRTQWKKINTIVFHFSFHNANNRNVINWKKNEPASFECLVSFHCIIFVLFPHICWRRAKQQSVHSFVRRLLMGSYSSYESNKFELTRRLYFVVLRILFRWPLAAGLTFCLFIIHENFMPFPVSLALELCFDFSSVNISIADVVHIFATEGKKSARLFVWKTKRFKQNVTIKSVLFESAQSIFCHMASPSISISHYIFARQVTHYAIEQYKRNGIVTTRKEKKIKLYIWFNEHILQIYKFQSVCFQRPPLVRFTQSLLSLLLSSFYFVFTFPVIWHISFGLLSKTIPFSIC